MTRAGARVMNSKKESPLPEYPRPQLQRDALWLSLNGWWEWQEVRGGSPAMGSPLSFRVRVPFPIESPLSGLALGGAAAGLVRMRYRRSILVPPEWQWPERCSVRLHFGAIDWRAAVRVNGMRVGVHSGGFIPFSVDIDRALHVGNASILEVDVLDPTDTRNQGQPVGKQRSLGGGIFYLSASGIWGTVWIEQIPLVASISSLQLSFLPPARVSANAIVEPTLARAANGHRVVAATDRFKVTIEVTPPSQIDGAGNAAGWWPTQTTSTSGHSAGSCVPRRWMRETQRASSIPPVGFEAEEMAACNVTLPVRDLPQLWSPETPRLYNVVARLYGPDGELIDVVRSYIGLRTVSILRDGSSPARILLNGKVRFSAGVLDQGYWPDGIYTAPTDEALANDIVAAKRLGFDLVRKHAKIESARWYYHADRLGVLVWQDMPSPPAITCKSLADGDPGWKRKKHSKSHPPPPPEPPPTPDMPEEREDDGITADHDGPERRLCPIDRFSYAQELRAMISWLSFSTSIVLWVIFNEAWGQHDTQAYVRAVRGLDSTRLVTDSSGWLLSAAGSVASTEPVALPRASHTSSEAASASSSSEALPSAAIEGKSRIWIEAAKRRAAVGCFSERDGDCGDVIDVHAYPGPVPSRILRKRWYGNGLWESLRWLRSPERVSVVGEFGGARFELRGHTYGARGWGYGKAAERTCDQFADELVLLWQRVSNLTGLSAAVYTQLTDVEEEWNGLLSYDREPKCIDLLSRRVAPEIERARRLLSQK